MDAGAYVILDGGLSFGVVIAICVYQLISTSRAKKQRIEREKAREAGEANGASDKRG